ncbi:50S ribosomal protein L2 [Striga asiatica]|uniref:50S ribosomal protein L2 n=1 Tax=Striga asiatica TaxID=4170 RepID=A0A5A7PB41_STRAF|nr:50S ribosomal protein L2 [Striga asiatica]
MNPVDHPQEGGEGRAPIGRKKPTTLSGYPALGRRSRKRKKYSENSIVHRLTDLKIKDKDGIIYLVDEHRKSATRTEKKRAAWGSIVEDVQCNKQEDFGVFDDKVGTWRSCNPLFIRTCVIDYYSPMVHLAEANTMEEQHLLHTNSGQRGRGELSAKAKLRVR